MLIKRLVTTQLKFLTRAAHAAVADMSLFSFGFRKKSSETGNESQATNMPLPTYLPVQVEPGLGREHDLVTTAVEANPEPEPKKRKTSTKYGNILP